MTAVASTTAATPSRERAGALGASGVVDESVRAVESRAVSELLEPVLDRRDLVSH